MICVYHAPDYHSNAFDSKTKILMNEKKFSENLKNRFPNLISKLSCRKTIQENNYLELKEYYSISHRKLTVK